MTRPLETVECRHFAAFIEDQNALLAWKKLPQILFSKLTQDFFINLTGKRKAQYLAKMHAEGKRPGVPDFIVLVPAEACRLNRALLFFVEMKRQKFTASEVKPEQLVWVEALRQVADVEAVVCGGAGEAKAKIKQYLKF